MVRLNRVTIYRLIREGQFPAMKVGSQWRFQRAAVEQWLTSQQPTTPAEQTHDTAHPNEYVAAFHNPEVILVLQAFAKAMGLSIFAIDPQGATILDCMNCHPFCVNMQVTQPGRARCQEVRDAFAFNEMRDCVTGASYIKTPVYVADQIIGYTVMGPLVRDAYHMEQMRQCLPETAAALGIAPEVLLRQLSAIQTLNAGQLEVLQSLLSTVMSTVVQVSVERWRTEDRLKTIARLATGS